MIWVKRNRINSEVLTVEIRERVKTWYTEEDRRLNERKGTKIQ